MDESTTLSRTPNLTKTWQTGDAVHPGDPILDPLRAHYLGFDAWLARVFEERRPIRVVRDDSRRIVGLLIAKHEAGLKVCSLVVAPDARRQGIGRALLDDAIALATSLGVTRVWATAHGDVATLSVFGAAGFGATDVVGPREVLLERPFDRQACVRTFHQYHELRHGIGTGLREEELRMRLIAEEVEEAIEAMEEGDLAHTGAELADIVFVSYGSTVTWGVTVPVDPPRAPRGEPKIRGVAWRASCLRRAYRRLERAVDTHDIDAATDGIRGLVREADKAATAFGIPLNPFLADVARANLCKDATNRQRGKLRKPDGWRPPAPDRRLAEIREARPGRAP